MTQDVATLPQAPSWYRGLGRYWALAGGELVSSAGSVMALFAVDTWVYEESRSVTVYGAVQLLAMLPAMLFAPFAGAWLDRLNGRRVIVGANVAIALVTLGLWALARTNRLSVWSFCIAAPLLASLGALLQLSIATATAHLVPVERFARASGVVGAGQALIGTCVPLAAGFTMQAIGIGGALLVDFATTLVAAVTAWCIVFPDPPRVDRPGERRSIVHETANGLRYLKSRAGLLGLLVLSGALAFAGRMGGILTTPIVLTLSTPAALGIVRGLGGAGALAGSLLISVLGAPRGKVMAIALASCALSGLCVVFVGVTSSIGVLAALVMVGCFFQTVAGIFGETIWRAQVPREMQGRSLAVRQTVVSAVFPAAVVATGPLCDGVIEPAMRSGGALAPTLGLVFGTGAGRGLGVLMATAGLLTLVAVAFGLKNRNIRRLDVDPPC